ncbi:MAG TPA: V-type ATP synthase subunit D [Trueperaceae bacterium]|nr:V-type ATP synthase subunit D [Trueperaceae bacterium]
MSRVRASKQELKRQRDALARFRRYLPTLQLKKRQLQMEVRRVEAQEREALTALESATVELEPWIALFAGDLRVEDHLRVSELLLGEANIAGIGVPVFEGVAFVRTPPDLYATPPFLDDAVAAVEALLRLRLQVRTLARQRELLEAELRITSQRVNLFEKVKIPEAERDIRTIRIALGDQQAAEVVRAKIAKGKTAEQGFAS